MLVWKKSYNDNIQKKSIRLSPFSMILVMMIMMMSTRPISSNSDDDNNNNGVTPVDVETVKYLQQFSLCSSYNHTFLRQLHDPRRSRSRAGNVSIVYDPINNRTTLVFEIRQTYIYGWKDWLHNVGLVRSPTKPRNELLPGAPFDHLFHAGLYVEALAVAPQVMSVLSDAGMLENTTWDATSGIRMDLDEIRFNGYSAAGIVTTILALYIQPLLKPHVHISLVTYGAPRIGSKRFARWASDKLSNATIYRCVNDGDGLPLTLLENVGWSHMNVPEYWIQDYNSLEDYKIWKCVSPDGLLESPYCSKRKSRWIPSGIDGHFSYFNTPQC